MSFKKQGFNDGLKGKKNPPKKDGFLGSSWGQSDRSKQRQDAYKGGQNQAEKELDRCRPKSWF